jgi:hypothetical protein
VPTVYKSGSLNLLEPSGPVQACNGTALHFYSRSSETFCSLHTSLKVIVNQSGKLVLLKVES